jgi:hypothetical protein
LKPETTCIQLGRKAAGTSAVLVNIRGKTIMELKAATVSLFLVASPIVRASSDQAIPKKATVRNISRMPRGPVAKVARLESYLSILTVRDDTFKPRLGGLPTDAICRTVFVP